MGTGNRIVGFYVTGRAAALVGRLMGLYPDMRAARFSKGAVEKAWEQAEALLFVMASGIAVRTIAPLLQDKKSDPAVVVIDESGRYAVSLLSGHLGGANEKAREIAAFLGGEAVITTASDVNRLTSIDLFARDRDLVIDDWKVLPPVAARLVNKGNLTVYSETGVDLPPEFILVADPAYADIVVTNRTDVAPVGALSLRPRNLVVGMGCNSGTSPEEIDRAVKSVFKAHGLAFSSLKVLATINVKDREPGIAAFAETYGLPIFTYSAEELNNVEGVVPSEVVFKATGAKAVAEPSAILGAKAETLLVGKQKIGNVTVAVTAMKAGSIRTGEKKEQDKPGATGRIYVVGTGPGNREHITPYAERAIRQSEVIVGYRTYIELIRKMIIGKEVFETGMTQEIDRCRKTVELALIGKTVAIISGGDPGIYAMAGLVFQLLKEQDRQLRLPSVEVIPGISALNACAARLGAPLMHDFTSISLSDRLTPWDLIEKRIDAAAMADFVIVLYNPKSKGRAGHISKARAIILRHRLPGTPVGIVEGAMRTDERIVITDLDKMLDHEINMQTTVIIGNSRTFLWNDRMVTPRGYEKKF
jgi:cobalt-precorrin 5A hydrolase/precorrin-3B C17-methyltransferase